MHQARIKRLQIKMRKEGLKAVALFDPINLFYFTGQHIESGLLVIRPASATLYVKEMLQQQYKGSKVLKSDMQIDGPIGFVEAKVSYLQFKQLKKMGRVKPTASVDQVRMVKDAAELRKLKASARLLVKGFKHIENWIKPGFTETQVALEFIRFGKANGASGTSFEPIVASGTVSSMPHYRHANRTIKNNQSVKLDFGYILDDYCSDMTRVIAVGNMPKRIATLYQKVIDAHDAALEAVRPGVPFSKLDAIARKALGDDAKYFIHSLGHGVGLEVHEEPYLRPKQSTKGYLEENMVFTIEPGLYIPHIGGVRYENTIHCGSGGGKILGW